jgi:hypothetical protein
MYSTTAGGAGGDGGQVALATTAGHNKVWSKGGVLKTIKTITC